MLQCGQIYLHLSHDPPPAWYRDRDRRRQSADRSLRSFIAVPRPCSCLVLLNKAVTQPQAWRLIYFVHSAHSYHTVDFDSEFKQFPHSLESKVNMTPQKKKGKKNNNDGSVTPPPGPSSSTYPKTVLLITRGAAYRKQDKRLSCT